MSQSPYGLPFSPFGPQVPRPNYPNNTDTFLAYMQDGKIFRQAPEGPQPIGVTQKTLDDLQKDYDDLYERCKEYYDALVEHGVIVPEPTQEQIIRQQAEQLQRATEIIGANAQSQQTLAGMISDLQAQIQELKNSGGNHAGKPDPVGHIEDSRPFAGVERTDRESVADGSVLRELPDRVAAGSPGAKGKAGRSEKPHAAPRKRAGGNHA